MNSLYRQKVAFLLNKLLVVNFSKSKSVNKTITIFYFGNTFYTSIFIYNDVKERWYAWKLLFWIFAYNKNKITHTYTEVYNNWVW